MCSPLFKPDFRIPSSSYPEKQTHFLLLNPIFRMTNIRYTNAQRLKALEVFDRTQSATKTVRELGYPGR